MTCSVEGCEKPGRSGMCRMHAERLRRTGTTDPRPRSERNGPPSRRLPDYRSVAAHGHPLANSIGNVYVHRLRLWEKVGSSDQNCHWCSREIAWFGSGSAKLCVDHVDGDRLNNEPDNLVPSCNGCNTGRSRRPDFLTHCAGGHRRSDANTRVRPDGARDCRACARERAGGRAA